MTTEQTESAEIPADVSVLSDGALLTDFCETGREIGFRTIVERHARMVSSVCTAVLGNQADVEDAFQATFFVLARKATRIRSRESLAAWLHRVALRCAIAKRKRANNHKTVPLPEDDTLAQSDLDKVSSRAMIHALHDQLDQLPEKYRIPLIVCYLQGEDCEEAAKRLRLTKAALHKRIQRGRSMLRRRLGVLGIACVGTISLAQATIASAASIPSGHILNYTVTVATLIKAGWANGLIAASGKQASIVLAQGVFKTMLIASIVKSSLTAASGVLLGLVAFATVSLAQEQEPPNPAQVAALAIIGQQDAESDEAVDLTVEPQEPASAALINLALGRYLSQDPRVTLGDLRGLQPGLQLPPQEPQVLSLEALRRAQSGQDAAAVNRALAFLSLANAREASTAELQARNAALTAANSRLEDRVADLERQLRLHEENERLRSENETLRTQVEALKKSLDDK